MIHDGSKGLKDVMVVGMVFRTIPYFRTLSKISFKHLQT